MDNRYSTLKDYPVYALKEEKFRMPGIIDRLGKSLCDLLDMHESHQSRIIVHDNINTGAVEVAKQWSHQGTDMVKGRIKSFYESEGFDVKEEDDSLMTTYREVFQDAGETMTVSRDDDEYWIYIQERKKNFCISVMRTIGLDFETQMDLSTEL